MATPPLFSVVVCTYNRAHLLSTVLQNLRDQTVSPETYEVLLIDNNSSDDTAVVAASFEPLVQYHLETEVGLSAARNRAMREARGRYVAYTDDDCRVPPEWLSVAREIVEHEAPGMLGGPYYAFYSGHKPKWYKDRYASRVMMEQGGLLAEDQELSGCNMMIRRDLLVEMGGFDSRLGMTGDTIAYAEESDLQRRMRQERRNEKLYYDPRLYVHHMARPEQMTLGWITRAAFSKGRCHFLARPEVTRPNVGRYGLLVAAARIVAALLLNFCRGLIQRDREQQPYVWNFYCESTTRYWLSLGKVYQQYRDLRAVSR